MSALAELNRKSRSVEGHGPWPRRIVEADAWTEAARALGGGALDLLGLWGELETVHMALLDENEISVLSLECPDGRFPSVGRHHAPALRLERAVRDLFGLEPEGCPDARPWLDHGRWGANAPLGRRPGPAAVPVGPAPLADAPGGASGNASGGVPAKPPTAAAYPFLPAEGESLHEIPVGPVHAGIIEPGHFRFTAAGETVVRLEGRLGYAHKGLEGLMAGAPLEHAARLAARASGDSTVAYSLAFARAAEAALGIEAPPRACWLRALMAELERLANHLGDIGAISNDAAFALLHAHCGALRERVLRAAGECFGHRLMREAIVPGGVAVDLGPGAERTIAGAVAEIRRRFPSLARIYDETASLQDRTVGTGRLSPELARRYAAGGYVGRASGRAFDARRLPGYPPYERVAFEVPVLGQGDVDARVRIRILEVEQSLAIIEQALEQLPAGDTRTAVPGGLPSGAVAAEGVALVEAFRGDVLVWLRLDADARVARCHLRDPSWFQWPLLEAVIEGNIVADFPLCNKSFNCSYSGHDL